MTSAYAYLRVSGLGQVDGDGFARQLLAIMTYAASHDIEIVRVYREEGVCGANELDGRPALQELIADLLSNGTRLVLVEKLDRLARALIVQETILQDLTRRGITLVSVSEPDLCTNDPTRTMIRQILGAFFEYERKMIVAKTRAARERIRKDGRNPGARLYSTDPVINRRCEGRKRFGHHAPEMLIVETIQRLSNQGVSCLDIASTLNDEGIPTRQGKKWHSGTVSKILSRQRNTSESQQTERELQ